MSSSATSSSASAPPPAKSAAAGEKGRERRVESMGWLTESTLMPKKHKVIEGVGAASLVDLKAQLYRTQEEARNPAAHDASARDAAEFRRAKRRTAPADPLGAKNSGVDARAHKDKLELKAVRDGSASYAALEKKAELYEKLSRGQLPDEEDNEKYCVDFFQKSLEQGQELQQPESLYDALENVQPADEGDNAMLSARTIGLGQTGVTIDRDEHKRFVREVHEEVSEARQKASAMKSLRQEQEAARREKLRQAYLKKRLEKLIAAKQAHPADDSLPAS